MDSNQEHTEIHPTILTTTSAVISIILMYIFLIVLNIDGYDLVIIFLLAFFVVIIAGVGLGLLFGIMRKRNENE